MSVAALSYLQTISVSTNHLMFSKMSSLLLSNCNVISDKKMVLYFMGQNKKIYSIFHIARYPSYCGVAQCSLYSCWVHFISFNPFTSLEGKRTKTRVLWYTETDPKCPNNFVNVLLKKG